MSDSMFTIDIDVSRALAAQESLIRKFQDVGNSAKGIASSVGGAQGEFSKVTQSVVDLKDNVVKMKDATNQAAASLSKISSETRFTRITTDLQKVNEVIEKLRNYNNLINLGRGDAEIASLIKDVEQLNTVMVATTKVGNTLARQLQSLPKFNFDFSSVEEYRLKLNNLGNELNALKMFKANIDPLDYSKMESGLKTAIEMTKQQFRDFAGSKDPFGMIAAWDRTYAEITAKAQSGGKDSLPVSNRYITGSEVADSMGLNYAGGLDTLTKQITEATNKVESEAKRLGQTLKTSIVGDATPSNKISSLLASTTEMLESTLGPAVIKHGEIWRSMGLDVDHTGEAMKRLSGTVKTSIDPSAEAYKKVQAAIQDTGNVVQDSEKKIKQMANAAKDSGEKLSGLGLVIKRVFEYGLVYRFQNALLSIPGALWDATTAIDRLKTSYDGMFGAGGGNEFKYALDSAQKYGKSIESVAESYKKFATTAEFVGLTQDQTKKAFESVNQAMVKSGNGSEQIKGAFLALEQMLNKGTVSAEEYRRQFAQYIPGAMKMGADAVGKTTAEFLKMMKAGELVSLDFIPKLMEQLGNFGEGWEKMASTIEANSERLKNSFTILSSNILTALFTESDIKRVQKNTQDMIDAINSVLEKNKPKADEKGWGTQALEALFYTSAYGRAALEVGNPTARENASKNSFDVQQYWVMWKDGVANAKEQLDELMKTPGDISPESAKNIRMVSEQLQVGIDLVHKLCDPSWTVNVAANVDTSQITYAMGLINKLYSTSKFGKLEDASNNIKNIEAEQGKMKELIGSLDSQMNASDISFKDREVLYSKKVGVQKDLEKSTVALTAAIGTYNDVLKASSQIENKMPYTVAPKNSGEDKKTQIEKATKHAEDMKKAIQEAYDLDQSNQGSHRLNKDSVDKDLAGWDSWLTGETKKINKQGSGGAKAAERAAISAEHYETKLDNLLKKEMQIAEDDPLGAAFTANAQKADQLAKEAEMLATRTGESIGEVQTRIAKFKAAADQAAADKFLEKIFPSMKKNEEVISGWHLLTDKFDLLKEKAEQSGTPVDELFNKLRKYLTETNPLLAKAAGLMQDMKNATNFADYAKAADELTNTQTSPGGDSQTAAMEELYKLKLSLNEGMLQSTKDMYKRIAEEATACGLSEAQAASYVASKWQESEVARLEALEKYGSASEAFNARLQQNFGTYKDAATKSREQAVQWADSITNAADSFASGVSQSIGDMIRNIGNGTASIEDLWKNMLSRMLDMLASFIESAVKNWLKDLIGGMFSNNGSSESGGFLKSLTNLFSGNSSSQSSSGINLSSFQSLFSGFGESAGLGLGEYFSNAGSSSSYLLAGDKNALSDIFSEGVDASKLGINAWKNTESLVPISAQAEAATTGLSTAGTAVSSLSSIGSVLGIIGAVGGLAGLAFSLFGNKNEKKKDPVKLYDGTMQSWSGGNTMAYSMEVMSDGTLKQKTVQPGDIQETQKAFEELTDTVKDAAKVLKIDLVENFVTSFSFMTGIISDELSDTASWVMQGKLGNEALGDLSNAVLFFSNGMQNVVEIFTGLAESASTVKGSIEALGIDFGKFASIDDSYIEVIADFAVNVSDSFDSLADSAMSASDYIAKYSDALRSLAEAQMSSLYEDALGGKDQFQSAMTTYATYGVTTKEQKTSALDYYTSQLGDLLDDFQEKFSDVLSSFGNANIDITDIDSFWSAYNAAMQQSMSPSMLAAWAEMASYAQLISTTSDDLDKVNLAESQWNSTLKARQQVAAGLDKEADLTNKLAGYEKELADARADGMTYTQQAALVQTEIAEMQAEYDKLTGKAVDYTASLDAALTKFVDTLSSTIERLSEVSSTASSLASTWEGISDSLDSAIESMKDDMDIDMTATINAKMKLLNDAFEKGMAGDSNMMAKVAGYATSAWDAAKTGAKTPEQYDTTYWTAQNRLATAKAASSGMTEYEKAISSLTGELVNIAEEMKKELESDSPDPIFLQQAKDLYAYTEDFQKYVDLYKAGRMSETEFNAAAKNSYNDISGWIEELVNQSAKLSADQVRALVTENDFIRTAIRDGSNLTDKQLESLKALYKVVGADSVNAILSNDNNLSALLSGSNTIAGLTESQTSILRSTVLSLDSLYNGTQDIGASTVQAILGSNEFLEAIMNGSVQLSGLSQQQATLLSSALTAMETVSTYTGQNLIYSDRAAYYLAQISDGLATTEWDSLIDTIADGQTDLRDSLLEGISGLNSTMEDLVDKAAKQEATTAAQAAYFEAIKTALYKQTQIELYTSLAQSARDTAVGYQNYAISALLTGTSLGMIVFAQWMEKYNAAMAEYNSMNEYLNYWNNYRVPAMADGGIVTAPTLAYIGEGRESEAVIPLSKLDAMISSGSSDDEVKTLLRELISATKENTRVTQVVADRVYDRDKNKPYAVRA